MKKPDYLKDMPNFFEAIEKNELVNKDMDSFESIIQEWTELIHRQFTKGLIPLFITGSGMSTNVPDMITIVKKLKSLYDSSKDSISNPSLKKNMDRLFETWSGHVNKDRSVVGRILNTFQDEKSELYPVWQELNKWLLEEIVKADPTSSHSILAKLYEDYNGPRKSDSMLSYR